MSNSALGLCKYCEKEQPTLNLFCINCNKRDWLNGEGSYQKND